MATTLDRFHKSLAAGEPAGVYLLAGEEPLLLQEAADALRARVRALGFAEREVYDVEPKFDWNSLARASASMSLFSARRLIELRLPTGRPDRDGAAAITEWCAAPPPDTVLLISAMQWSRKHEGAWVKTVERAGVYVPIRPLGARELLAWIGARMRSRGFAPSGDAVAVLASRAEGNLLAAAQEIDKLALLREGGRVGAEELEALVADSAHYDVFKLTDAAFAGDAVRALRVFAGLRAEGEDMVPLLGWLLNQLGLAVRLAGASDFAAAARSERLWQAREQLFRNALRRGSVLHWQRCVAWCARIDRMIKGRELGDPWREFERLLVAIAQPRAASVLA